MITTKFKPRRTAVSNSWEFIIKPPSPLTEITFLSGLIKVETEFEGVKQEAYRPKLVLHYIQDYYIKPDVVFDISPFYDRKIEAIKAFKSQFHNPDSNEPQTPISGEDFFEYIKGRAIEFGRPIGVKYGEGFTSDRLIGVNSLKDII